MLALSLLSAAGAAPLPEPQAAALTRRLQSIVDDPGMPLPGLSVVAIRRGDGGSYRGLYHAWGLGNQQFTDTSIVRDGRASGDRLVEGGGFTGVGHLGWSWGLNALFAFDPASNNGMIYVSTGVGADPDRQPGKFSSEARFQERITDALYLGAIAP
jgi:CubicO group peptidase (beta-lactamase class C family)